MLYYISCIYVIIFVIFSSFSSVASWTLTPPSDATGWRHIRVRINGPNASGQSHYLSLSGLEIYGEVRGLADEDLGKLAHCDTAVVCIGMELTF